MTDETKIELTQNQVYGVSRRVSATEESDEGLIYEDVL